MVITSQTLVAAVVGSIREYATLNALGVGVNALLKWSWSRLSGSGHWGCRAVRACRPVLSPWAAHSLVAPVQLSPVAAVACLFLSMLPASAGLAAIRTLRHADPASLLEALP